ncbi:PhzF family phenazine biosynthesis protein [Kinneretia asaccharophila]|uniref:PhzF family phenazine biosynthesis protein n=1 Tax=Roseateles asaccharophilus TaxID=582607 RepID=A0A4R6N9Q9_9BURK|nr:PhzF family phenazine biosynthesis protein [Roseateles asaccharophilus]MDN3545001.1 PhzF family phenazine biosynthesis protein [Roseateles asaccharophilus]TDP12613.1 PhzF family phenazine biosynthesis protein [Roseateles asaccharophilus]
MSELRRFVQVDVFTAQPLKGNPLAVVVDAAGLDESQMAAFARWTNLSETTFLLPPTDPAADYRVRIFTPGGELPFAGHPTLGSAHAWLASGGDPKRPGELVQQCGIGLVRVKREGARLAFAAPPLRRSGPVQEAGLREQVLASLRVPSAELLDLVWVDNGPGWMAARLKDAAAVRALQPDFVAMRGLKLGVVGAQPEGAETQFELRAFVPTLGVPEDPVTGSLNAGVALWLQAAGLAPEHYVASQGSALGRDGRVYVRRVGDQTWIGGDVTPLVHGQVRL